MPQITLPQGVKGIIYDLDGTLADTMPVHYKACQLICNERGFDFPTKLFYDMAGIPTHKVFKELVRQLNLNYDSHELADLKEAKFLELIEEVTPLGFVHELALEYKGKLPQAIGSGGLRNTVIKTLQAIDMEHFFEAVVSSDDVKNHKPFPDTFIKCAEIMKIAPQDCVVLEDGDPGLEAAQRAGMHQIDIRKLI